MQGTLHQSWSSLFSLIINQQKFFGTNYGLTTKIPASSFKITAGEPNVLEADNGSGHLLHREFCGVCGGGILEYGVSNRQQWRKKLEWETC
jgi:hypothetical protein